MIVERRLKIPRKIRLKYFKVQNERSKVAHVSYVGSSQRFVKIKRFFIKKRKGKVISYRFFNLFRGFSSKDMSHMLDLVL